MIQACEYIKDAMLENNKLLSCQRVVTCKLLNFFPHKCNCAQSGGQTAKTSRLTVCCKRAVRLSSCDVNVGYLLLNLRDKQDQNIGK